MEADGLRGVCRPRVLRPETGETIAVMESSEQSADVETEVALIKSLLQVRSLQVDDDAVERVRRMLKGKLSLEQARAEIALKYGRQDVAVDHVRGSPLSSAVAPRP